MSGTMVGSVLQPATATNNAAAWKVVVIRRRTECFGLFNNVLSRELP
jgi:hypothetical protein